MGSQSNNLPVRKSAFGITFDAPHLHVSINQDHPPPIPSQRFQRLRQQVDTTWSHFERAELALVTLDDAVHADVLSWISSSKGRLSQEPVWKERQRIVVRLHKPAIAEAERRCSELGSGIEALEAAAQEESDTLEGRAAVEIDVPVMKSGLATTLEIVDAARAQWRVAKEVLGLE